MARGWILDSVWVVLIESKQINLPISGVAPSLQGRRGIGQVLNAAINCCRAGLVRPTPTPPCKEGQRIILIPSKGHGSISVGSPHVLLRYELNHDWND
jgi:hypothetical protein